MDDNIYEKQQNPLIIQCFFAQRKKYNQAKTISGLYFIICGVLACIFLALTSKIDNDLIKGLSIGLSIATVFFKDRIETSIEELKTTAARIQQYIDVFLYTRQSVPSIINPWSCYYNKDEIIELVSKYPQKGFNNNDCWYEDYSSEPFYKQILLCQKENIRWDQTLRKKIAIAIECIIAIIVVSIVVFGLVFNHTVLKTLSIVSWCLPFLRLLIEYKKNIKEDNCRLEKMTKYANSILKLDISASEEEWLEREKILQNDIYEHRRLAFLIPSLFYSLFRSKQEKTEGTIAVYYKKGE
jgi:hypothetical protein